MTREVGPLWRVLWVIGAVLTGLGSLASFFVGSASGATSPLSICVPGTQPELCAGATVISAPLSPTSVGVLTFRPSPDGQRVAYLADPAKRTVFELFGVPAKGGSSVKLNAPLPPAVPFTDHDVAPDFRFSGGRVVYRVVRVALGTGDLWSAASTGGGAVRLSPVLPPACAVEEFSIRADGQVRYRADVLVDQQFAWYVVPAAGGRSLQEIFLDGFEGGSSSSWSRP
jgi:hypothetical protein